MLCEKFLKGENKTTSESFEIKTEEVSCSNPELYLENDNTKVYLSCIKSITKNDVALKDEFNENILNELTSKMEVVTTNSDYNIYKDFQKISNNGFSIIKCNNNSNIYIGPKNLNYNVDMCKVKNTKEGSTFIKTYNILNIAESNEEKYVYLTIRAYQEENVVTVRVNKDLNKELKEDNSYEFTFKYTDNLVEDDIESIFANTTLIKIEKTDKTGMEQIQDLI